MTAPSPSGSADSAAGFASRRHRILIVDDEVDIRETLRDLFQAYLPQVDVTLAGSGAEATQTLARQSFDLILTDYKMPGMTGLELLRESRRMAPTMPRIMMTAFPDLELAIRAVNDGKIETFLTKPIEREPMLDAIRTVLSERLSREQKEQAFARAMNTMRRGVPRAPSGG